jgi:hypothetical protein
MAQGRYDQAGPLHLQCIEGRKRVFGAKHPATAACIYNLACNEALRGDRATAMDWLRRAVEAGYPRPGWFLKDPDLESLRGPELDALVERARRNASVQRAD